MSAREPLPYPHPMHPDAQATTACCVPEADLLSFYLAPECRGCRAMHMALAVRNPEETARTSTGRKTLINALRESTDPLDPMRVLFERALRERGIA